ncbi:MAG: pilus assembly protein PilP [Wenzhouxiangellaceae bacterium]|nr:pilus assembly protein PilP [Wenzhouxiangellaceae bacterium]
MRWIKHLLAGIAATTLLAACGGGKQDLEQWVENTLERPPAPIEPIPRVVTPEPVIYDAYELRDPFLRPSPEVDDIAGNGKGTGPRPDPDRRREYLEQFPLDALDMVGTIELGDQTFGLIADPEDTIHRVQAGNYIGQNHGRILSVTPVSIEIMELVPDGADGWTERESEIALPEQDQRG